MLRLFLFRFFCFLLGSLALLRFLGSLCLGAGVHTVQAFATGKTDVPAVVSGSVIGSGILGLNYTHAAAKKIGPKQARVMHRVFCGVTGLGMAMHIFAVKQPKG